MLEKQLKLSVVIKIVVFAITLCGVWYSNKHQVDLLKSKVERLETELHQTNLRVLQKDVHYLKEELEELEEFHKKKKKNDK